MNVREVKAYIHRSRIPDVVDALHNARFRTLTVVNLAEQSEAKIGREQQVSGYCPKAGVPEAKLEVFCENESRTAEAVNLIRVHAKTGLPASGWIYITTVQSCIEIVG